MKQLRLSFSLRFQLLIFSLLVASLAACGSAPQETGELPTLAQLPSETPSPSPTATPDVSPTPLPPSFTPSITLTPSNTLTSTLTPSLTITNTNTPTPSPTIVDTPLPNFFDDLAGTAFNHTPPPTKPIETALAELTLTPLFGGGGGTPGLGLTPGATNLVVIPPDPGSTQVSSCQTPPGGFGTIYLADLTLQSQLGCAIGLPPAVSTQAGAAQTFETGVMLWVAGAAGQRGTIYVFNNGGGVTRLIDTYDPAVDPETGGEQPPSGLLEPVRGFGKVWRTTPDVRARLGWATAPEVGGTTITLNFDRGMMIDMSTRNDVLILFIQPGAASGTWRSVVGGY